MTKNQTPIDINLPGDKSITHRALMVAAIAEGTTVIDNPLRSDDTKATVRALGALGVQINNAAEGNAYIVEGSAGRLAPTPGTNTLEMGNSGTTARLMLGLLSGFCPYSLRIDGDASLRKRPMGRVTEPLEKMGAQFFATLDGIEGDVWRLPIQTQGIVTKGIMFDMAKPDVPKSAQVKSAVLLAGLGVIDTTIVHESDFTRDHTERMLLRFGADLRTFTDGRDMNRILMLYGGKLLVAPEEPIQVPNDPSSAMFFLVASALTQKPVFMKQVSQNPSRMAGQWHMEDMGLRIVLNPNGGWLETAPWAEMARDLLTEPKGVLRARDTAADEAVLLIDEFPALFVAAAFANGTSTFHGLGELRTKESNRIDKMLALLRLFGVPCDTHEDSVIVRGSKGRKLPGSDASESVLFDAGLDHRIAMCCGLLNLHSKKHVELSNPNVVESSFPGFWTELGKLAEK